MIVKRRPFRKISWGAIFAGVLVALVVQLLLSLLGLAIGFGNINPMTETDPFAGIGTPALVWWVVSMLISLFAGGLTAGRLSGVYVGFDRMLHGFLTFSVFSIVTFFLITTAIGGVINGVGSVVGKSLSYTGQDQELKNRAQTMAENFQQRAGALTTDTLKKYEPEIRRTGQDVASTASKVSLFAFIGLVLGAAAASAGSSVGKPKKEISEIETEDDINENSNYYSEDLRDRHLSADRERERKDAELRERERELKEREIRDQEYKKRDMRDQDFRDPRDPRDPENRI